MLDIFQICCYGDKYLVGRKPHSNNDVTQSGAVCCEKALWYLCSILSSSETYFQSSSLNKKFLSNWNLKGRVVTAVEKKQRAWLLYVGSTMSHFLLKLKYFLWNTGALPYFTQLPSKLWEMRSATTWGKPVRILTNYSHVHRYSGEISLSGRLHHS